MNIVQLFTSCFRSIFRNRMRSFLTSLGIIIGVGSVIIMLAVGQGTQKSIESQISAMGTNLLQVSAQMVRSRNNSGGMMARPAQLTKSDLEKLEAESSYAQAISGIVQRSFTVTGASDSATVTVLGVEPGYLIIKSWTVARGAFFGEDDVENRSSVAVIGSTTATNLFGDADPIGERIRIGSDSFYVVGILETKGTSAGQDQDDTIMVPLTTAMSRLTNSKTVNTIAISVVSEQYMTAAAKETELILREAHGLSAEATADFSIMNSADLLETMSSVTGMLTMLLAAIAGVSLLVGGIGIMNIMLVSVTERTREIGIRMSVGARKMDILFQFLMEAMILSLLGGGFGILMAFGACELLARFSITTYVNPLIVAGATGFSAMIGIFFGFFPARKAAGLYPIDALRYE